MTVMDALMPSTGTFVRSLVTDKQKAPAAAADNQDVDCYVQIHLAKYIIIRRIDGEFPILFPAAMRHSHMVPQDAIPVAAGFYQIIDTDTLLVSGESTSLNLKSRPQDAALIRALLNRNN